MALKLLITDNKGQSTEYHKIERINAIYLRGTKTIHILLSSYTNEEYRRMEDETNYELSVTHLEYNLPILEVEDLSRETLYARLKAEVPELAEAVDC